TFDERDRLLSETRVVGLEDDPQNGETNDLTTSTTYDVHGNVLSHTDVAGNTVYRSYYMTNGQLASETDPLGNTSVLAYHPHFVFLAAALDPLGNISRFGYSSEDFSQILNFTDPQGNAFGFDYNSFGDIV